MLDLYRNIRMRREELGMSQEQLAKKVGYTSRSTIARIERGDFDLSQSKIMEIAKALRISAGELMGLDGIETEYAPAPSAEGFDDLVFCMVNREDVREFVDVARHADPADVKRMTDFLKRITAYYQTLKEDNDSDNR